MMRSPAVRRSDAASASSAATASSRVTVSANGAEGLAGASVTLERVVGGSRRGAPGFGFGENLLLPFEPGLFVGVLKLGVLKLGDLETQQVDLARPGPRIASEARECVVDGADAGTGLLERPAIDAAERVERAALDRRCKEGLVGVLAVQIDQTAPPLCERRHRRHPAVDVCPAASAGWHRPGEDDLDPVRRLEATLDPRLACAGAHEHRVGAASDEEFDRLDDEGLPRPGLAGERGHPRSEDDRQIVDHAEIANRQFEQHPDP
jgi:hypothetical protein